MWTVKNFPPSFSGKIPVQVRGNPTPKIVFANMKKYPKSWDKLIFGFVQSKF